MDVLVIPENFPVTKKDDYYFSVLKGLCYVVNKFGIDIVVEDLEKIQNELGYPKIEQD